MENLAQPKPSPESGEETAMKTQLTTFIGALAISAAGAGVCNAGVMVTWTANGGSLDLSVQGDWSSWDSATTLTSTDTLLFGDNGTTTFAFDLSRGTIGGVGQSVIMDTVAGSGSVTAPDFNFGPPLPTTGYNITYFNAGGLLALEAEVASAGTFTINESFDLGSTFTLTPGTRTFSSSTAPGDTLTMRYVSGTAPEPGSFALLGCGIATLALARRRRSAQNALRRFSP